MLLPSRALGQYCAYVSTPQGVLAIDTSSNQIAAQIPLYLPDGAKVTVAPDGRFLYVPSAPGVAVVNTATNAVTRTFQLGQYGSPPEGWL